MTESDQINALEAALLARAKTLANEHLAQGRHSRERIIGETNEKLRQRQERELLNAKALADRTLRQRVQAGELKLQEELDRLGWALMRSIMAKVNDRLARLVEDEAAYLPILAQYLRRAAEVIERQELVAEVNAGDLERLRPRWDRWSQELSPEKPIALSSTPRPCIGGIVVQSSDGQIRVDNTFEGRMERLQDELHRVIMECLFAAALSGEVGHG